MAGVADLKLVLIGSKNVGKTSVFNRYVYDEFGKTSMTIGAYFGTKTVKLCDRTRNLAIWDTAGEEKFDSLTNFYCRGAAAALVCYDITSYESFAGLQRWVDKIIQEADKNCAMILVGNKLDIVEKNPALRKVDLAEAKRYASSVGATVVEASAKNGTHVTDIFEQVVQTCLDRQAGQMQTSGKTKKSTGTASGGSFPEPKDDADKSKCCS